MKKMFLISLLLLTTFSAFAEKISVKEVIEKNEWLSSMCIVENETIACNTPLRGFENNGLNVRYKTLKAFPDVWDSLKSCYFHKLDCEREIIYEPKEEEKDRLEKILEKVADIESKSFLEKDDVNEEVINDSKEHPESSRTSFFDVVIDGMKKDFYKTINSIKGELKMLFESIAILPMALIIFAVIIIAKGVRIVPQSDLYVVERLGKFNAVLHGGFHVIIPIVDSIRVKLTSREQLVDIPKQSVITKDNVNISIDGIVFCKVDDAKEATYNVVSFKNAIANLAMTTLRSEIGSMELDGTLSNRESLNAKLQTELGSAAANWGIKVTRVEISDIEVPKQIEKAMNMQMEAEREKRAIETKAKADKEAQIREAEAFKQSEVLKAEAIERMADAKKYEQEKVAAGQKEAMKLINESMAENEKAAEFLLAKDRIVAFKALAESPSNDKMILPYEVSQMIGSTSILGEAFFSGMNKGKGTDA